MTMHFETGHSRFLVLRDWLLPSRTMERRILPPGAGLVYVAVIALMGGLRPDHVLLGMLGLLDLYNEKTRLFLRLFFPLIVTGAIYDSMRYFYWPAIGGRVHVDGPYGFELRWFGVSGQTLNEFFAAHHWAEAFRGDHDNVDVCPGDNRAVMNREAVRDNQRLARPQMRCDLFFVNLRHFRIRQREKNDIRATHSLGRIDNFKTGAPRRHARFAFAIKPNDDGESAVAQV